VIHRRYLFEGRSFSALSRHGIARLWWGAKLTKDTSKENPFELTDVLFMRQDIQVSLLERAIGKSRVVRSGVLEYFRANRATGASSASSKRVQTLLRELNLWGGVTILDALPESGIIAVLESVARREDARASDVEPDAKI
jgi:Family of unknown function (DUF6339)